MTRVPAHEEFSNPSGMLENYTTYDDTVNVILHERKHRDIRVFENTPIVAAPTVATLSTNTVGTLTTQTVSSLQSSAVIRPAEEWVIEGTTTGGFIGPNPARNNIRNLAIPLATTDHSVISIVSRMSQYPVDIMTDFDDDDFLSIAMPSFPSGVYLNESYLSLTSDAVPFGAGGQYITIRFNSSYLANPLVAGTDCEFRIRRGDILSANSSAGGTIDLSQITGVRIAVSNSSSVPGRSLTVTSLRMVSKDWVYGKLDIDTRSQQFRLASPPNGNLATTPAFTLPIIWNSAAVSGDNDPRPINGELGVTFHTGSMLGTSNFGLYFRETNEDYTQMLDLDGSTVAELDGKRVPDTGLARFTGRHMTDLDPFSMSELNNEKQSTLERVPDQLSSSYVLFSVQWSNNSSSNQAAVTNSENTGYNFSLGSIFSAHSTYAAFASLEENAARLTIYTLDSSGRVTSQIFDSTRLVDDFAFKRRKGRIGWSATLADGDAYIGSIRARDITYAEYRSLPYESFTPVVGAELFVTTTPPAKLVSTLAPGPYNNDTTEITKDAARSTTGESWRVRTSGNWPMQGLQSNFFVLTDPDEARLTFDLFYPSSIAVPLAVQLIDISGQHILPLTLRSFRRDQWQSVTADIVQTAPFFTGTYKLIFLIPSKDVATFWLDNVNLYERSVSWSARNIMENPWRTNPAPWTPFFDNHSEANRGVLFDRRGKKLQVRGRARKHDARIDRIQFKPKYAELGRLVFDTSSLVGSAPIAGFTSTSIGSLKARFTSTATDLDGAIVNVEWNFGDGTSGIGSVVDHTFATSSVYTVTQTVTDNNGLRSTLTQSISV